MTQVNFGTLDFLIDLLGLREIELFSELHTMNVYLLYLIAALAVVVGVLHCLLGFKGFKVWCSLIGFIVGVTIGVVLVGTLMPPDAEFYTIISILIIVLTGLLGIVLAYKAYLVGVFLFAFAAVFSIVYFPISAISGSWIAGLIAGFCIGTAGGILAVIFQRLCIIIATSVAGGTYIALGTMLLLDGTHPVLSVGLPILLGIGSAVGGVFFQLATVKEEPKKDKQFVVLTPVQTVTQDDLTVKQPDPPAAPVDSPTPPAVETPPVQIPDVEPPENFREVK